MDHSRIVELAEAVNPDLAARIDFLLEIDKLKSVLRRSVLIDGSRRENTAEHSWHLALAVLILAPHADTDATRGSVDVARAVEMLLVHDLVEIDAGDTYIYDTDALADKEAREEAAAQRIFNLLPDDQAAHVDGLWREYEARDTPTARFAYAVDRLQPMLLNAGADGASWQRHDIAHSQAARVNQPIGEASTALWTLVDSILAASADEGLLTDDRAASSR